MLFPSRHQTRGAGLGSLVNNALREPGETFVPHASFTSVSAGRSRGDLEKYARSILHANFYGEYHEKIRHKYRCGHVKYRI